MIDASVLEAMVKAGCTAEQLVAVVRAEQDGNAEKLALQREQARIRKQRQRQRETEQKQQSGHAMSRVTQRDERDIPSSPDGLEGSTPPKTLNPISPPSSLRSSGDARVHEEFHENFWPAYPNKVGKPEALKAFVRARNRTSLETITAGLQAYRAKTDDRPWCNPSTWLNQDRWNDQPAFVPKQQGPPRLTSDAMIATLQRHLDDDDDSPDSHQPRDHQDPYDALFRLAAKGHDRD